MKKIFLLLCLLVMTFNVTVAKAETTLKCKTTMLQYGSQGEEVKTLQKELNKTIKCNLVEDGIIGPKTEACIIKFQIKYRLVQDGIVGPKTCAKLNAKYNIKINTEKNKKNTTNDNNNNNSTKIIYPKTSYGIVTATELNVRKGPGTDSEIVTTVKKGRLLKIYDEITVDGKTWYTIYIDGTYASVSAKCVKKITTSTEEQKQV